MEHRRLRPSSSLLPLLMLTAIACGEEVGPGPGGSSGDAGAGVDGGWALDVGPAAEDAGTGATDGPLIGDAGTADGSTPGGDAGDDAGPGADAGDDAGAATDAGEDAGPGADGSAPDGGAPDGGLGDGGALRLTPSAADVVLGGTETFEVDAPAGAAVTWAVDGLLGGDATRGTLTPGADARTALYQAPRAPLSPPPGRVDVTATVDGEVVLGQVSLLYAAPQLSSLSPDTASTGRGALTLTLTGSGFTSATEVLFGGVWLPLQSAQWDELTVEVPAGLFLLPGERPVSVRNPAPGGGMAVLPFTVVLTDLVLGPGVAPDVPALFDAATPSLDPGRRPAITYPEDGSVAPRDFPPPAVSWAQAADANVCRLSVTGTGVNLEVYANTANLGPFVNPNAAVDAQTWALVLASGGGLELSLEVACAQVVAGPGGVLSLAGGAIDVSVPVLYRVLTQAAGGRVVYFSGFIEGLWRIDVGSYTTTGLPFIGPTPAFAYQTDGCVGCHSVATNGTRMSYTTGVSEFAMVDIGSGGTPTPGIGPVQANNAEWTALHPSGRWLVGVSLQGTLNLFDTTSGALLLPVPTATVAQMVSQPFWSPVGDRLAFVATDNPGNGVHDVNEGEIWTIDFTGTATGAPSFGALRRVVGPEVPGGNAYYPAFSPDGRWIVFCRADQGASFNNPGATVWLVRGDGAGGAVRLGRANRAGALSNSWPRWAPSFQPDRYWVVFSSQRPYPPVNGGGPQQLWVTHLDTSAWPQDPSAPAIWLSGQEPFTGNLTAEWSAAP